MTPVAWGRRVGAGTWVGHKTLLAEGFLEEVAFAARAPLIFYPVILWGIFLLR